MKPIEASKRLARKAVEQYFRTERQLEKLKRSLAQIEQMYPNCTSNAVQKIKRDVRKIEINRENVRRVLNRQDTNKKAVIDMKYNRLMTDLAIYTKLGVPVATLQRWYNEFLQEIEYELLGKIDFKRLMFQYNELRDIISKLSEDIAFFEKISILVDLEFIDCLKAKKKCYEQFEKSFNKTLSNISSKEQKIIQIKLNERITDEEIAARCFVSRSLVTTYINNFRDSIYCDLVKEQVTKNEFLPEPIQKAQ
jgi:hypothetical protein